MQVAWTRSQKPALKPLLLAMGMSMRNYKKKSEDTIFFSTLSIICSIIAPVWFYLSMKINFLYEKKNEHNYTLSCVRMESLNSRMLEINCPYALFAHLNPRLEAELSGVLLLLAAHLYR
jgi:hypothetical protein